MLKIKENDTQKDSITSMKLAIESLLTMWQMFLPIRTTPSASSSLVLLEFSLHKNQGGMC